MNIEIKNLIKKYGKKKAVDDINMVLDSGVYGLLGPNGAGKSTLMNILTGNLSQTGGNIFCDGREIGKMGREYRKLLGYMPQQQAIYPSFTGREFLNYMAVLKEVPKQEITERISWAASKVNLGQELEKRLHAYSGGMKQRILLASVILNNPRLLILDEPTAGLDPQERIRIRNLISSIATDKIVIIATHVVPDVEYISKQIILMEKGRIIRKDSIRSLTEEIQPYVFEIQSHVAQIYDIEKSYHISNILSDGQQAHIRVISKEPPHGYTYQHTMPTLDDVYLYHFSNLERGNDDEDTAL